MHYDKLIVIIVGLGSILLLVGLVYLLFVLPTPSYSTGNSATTSIPATLMKDTLKAVNATEPNKAEVIAKWYMPLIPLTLGSSSLQASVADTEAKREQGLSGTPYIPTGVVKLFIFDTPFQWAFWMKDMNYPIDIIWLDEDKTVVHIESNLTPETYPKSFAPSTPAKYVIETPAGFAEINHITIEAKATW
jgi:hypothetical protein